MKKFLVVILCILGLLATSVMGCGASETEPVIEAVESSVEEDSAKEEPVEEETVKEEPAKEDAVVEDAMETTVKGQLMIAAAASLENCLTSEIIPLFNKSYPEINVTGTYDSSGKLQTQIEEGAEVDVFFSAATKQMKALSDERLIVEGSIVNLLENKIVLIVPKGSESNYSKFEDIVKAESIAIGDPESVPAGEYAKESLSNLGIWEAVIEKASLGTNVTEVLNWVVEGSADAGVVYATDAAQTDKVSIIDTAPADSVKQAIYPVGIVSEAKNADTAALFVEFLQTPEVIAIFEANGFNAVK